MVVIVNVIVDVIVDDKEDVVAAPERKPRLVVVVHVACLEVRAGRMLYDDKPQRDRHQMTFGNTAASCSKARRTPLLCADQGAENSVVAFVVLDCVFFLESCV